MEHTEYYQLSLWEQDDRILREDFNADNAKIDAALAAMPIVKLKDVTLGAGTQNWNIDVSGIDFTQYRKIELDIFIPTTNSIETQLTINNCTSCYARSSGGGGTEQRTYLAKIDGGKLSDCYDPQCFLTFNMPVAGRAVRCLHAQVTGVSFTYYDCIAWGVHWENLTSFQLTRTAGSMTTLPAGCKFILTGYKK